MVKVTTLVQLSLSSGCHGNKAHGSGKEFGALSCQQWRMLKFKTGHRDQDRDIPSPNLKVNRDEDYIIYVVVIGSR